MEDIAIEGQAALHIRNVRRPDGFATEFVVREGRVAEAGANLSAPGAKMIDGGGALALPGFVDAHAHLDKSLLGMDWHSRRAGRSLREMIDDERRLRRELGIDPERQARRQIALGLSKGTTAIRTHVDIDNEHGLRMLEGLCEARRAYQEVVRIEIVAFPQSGCVSRPGTAELLEQAMREGADIVGGLDPSGIDGDPKGQLDIVFDIADRHGKPVDIHLHEPGELGLFDLEMILERTRALGMDGRVAVSHAFCLGMNDQARVETMLERLAAHEVAIVTTTPPSRPVPSLRDCREHGILVASGNDGIQDTWSPYGNADMLERAMFVGQRNDLRGDDELAWALDACSAAGARLMGLDDHGLLPGRRADIVLVAARTAAEAVAQRPDRSLVIANGQVVARAGQTDPRWCAE